MSYPPERGLRVLHVIDVFAKICIAGIGVWLTFSFNQHQKEQHRLQQRLQEVSAMVGLLPLATSSDSVREALAVLTMKRHTDSSLVADIAHYLPTRAGSVLRGELSNRELLITSRESSEPAQRAAALQVLDERMAGVVDSAVVAAPTESTVPQQVRYGWVYLGNYYPEFRMWDTRYFLFSPTQDPHQLRGSTLKVGNGGASGLNVRQGPPDEYGHLGAYKGWLPAGTEVQVLSVQPWEDSGFMWARISYYRGK